MKQPPLSRTCSRSTTASRRSISTGLDAISAASGVEVKAHYSPFGNSIDCDPMIDGHTKLQGWVDMVMKGHHCLSPERRFVMQVNDKIEALFKLAHDTYGVDLGRVQMSQYERRGR
jgi:hypothetical protein